VQDIGEAVPQGRRCEDVVAILKREILLRQYVPGDVLPREEMLAQRYGVSRAMIREALGVLKANGYLEARRGKHGGTFVKDLLESSKLGDLFGDLILMGKMQIGDLLSARLLIEPEAARLAAMNATRRELQHLADLNEMASIASDKLERTDRNVDFHVAIGQFSGNPFYAISIRSFMSFTRLFVEVVGEPMPYVHDDEAHQRLLQALQAREPQLAFERMYVHVSGMKSAMVSQEQLLRESTLV
jgi:DNA-binding FadR family transcriptional regulator